MSLVAGIDYSTHAVDVVLLDEDTDRAEWVQFPLAGADAFARARDVRHALMVRSVLRDRDRWDDTLAIGIEEPRGYNAGALYRVQGAILACLPRSVLVQPWLPSSWRKAVGLSGSATKVQVAVHAHKQLWEAQRQSALDWPQDACDAYCIALATRNALQKDEAA